MSLINDALKRAKEAQQQNQPAADGPPLRPAEPAQGKTGSSSKTLLYIMVACVVFGNALLFFAVGWKKETLQTSQPAPVPVASTTTPTTTTTTPVAAAPATPVPASQPAIVGTNPVPVSASVTGSNSPFAAPPVVAVEPEPPKPAPLKLQSIIYNPSRPSAMISGKFLFIGDKLRGFRVAAIDQETVTLIGNGETNVLSLP